MKYTVYCASGRRDRLTQVGTLENSTYQRAIEVAKHYTEVLEAAGVDSYVVEVRDESGEAVWVREKITNYEE